MDYDDIFTKIATREVSYELIIEDIHDNAIDVATIRNHNQLTLLHVAAGSGRPRVVEYLIAQDADVNAVDIEGKAPLHNACSHGHYSVANLLIKAGAEVNLQDSRGWSPLDFALSRKANHEQISEIFWKVVELLLRFGANPYSESTSGKLSIDRVKNLDNKRTIRLKHLQYVGDLSKFTIKQTLELIKDFFEVIKYGDTNLELLESLMLPQLVNSRLSDCDNITPLHRAAGFNQIEVAKLLIKNQANIGAVDSFDRIPLHNAAQYGHVEMIELLVNEKSDINKQDIIGCTPLHVASSNTTFAACLKLVQLGADVNARNFDGKLPYDLAVSEDVREVLKPVIIQHQPSTSENAVYIDIQSVMMKEDSSKPQNYNDGLMLDSSSNEDLFANKKHNIKKIMLNENDWRYMKVKKKMLETIMVHLGESGGTYTSYEIISIEQILNQKVWSKYKLMCQKLEIDYGKGSKNEKLLFHGSKSVHEILSHGFDERYAQRNGMFGAGIYFAEHSSKSNQYAFGFGQGCSKHSNKSCYQCERTLIYAQVALGRSLTSKEAMPECIHAPPGYSSVTGTPLSTDNLIYPEYVIYSGDQGYPLYVIRYKIKL